MKLAGLWVPLVTPMYRGDFDPLSMQRLIGSIDAKVDGYVVALSTGEGRVCSSAVRRQAIETAVTATERPVAAGIFSDRQETIASESRIAETSGATAVVVPIPPGDSGSASAFAIETNANSALPVILYCTESSARIDTAFARTLDGLEKIMAVKDSSGDPATFEALQTARPSVMLLQGLEDRLLSSRECDGYLVSLANLEPDLCRAMLDHPTAATNERIMVKYWEYNLGGEWYVTIKALLYARGILSSAEQVPAG